MRLPTPLLCLLIAAFIAAGATRNASASMVDWNTLSWAPGSLSNSYNVDPSIAGSAVTFTFSGDTGWFATDPTTGIQTPAIDSTMEGGMSPVQKSLDMAMSLTTNKVITLTVTFSPQYLQGVTNVSFTLFGINLGTGTDTVNKISALSIDGSTLVAPTITNVGPAVQLSGTGVNQVLTGIGNSPHGGPGSGDGNATITFSGAAIQSFTFSFQDGSPGLADSQIAISNLSFDVVPEGNVGLIASLFCSLILGVEVLRTRRSRYGP
jgi:hypothetical protein